jgi:hypothetical protein
MEIIADASLLFCFEADARLKFGKECFKLHYKERVLKR